MSKKKSTPKPKQVDITSKACWDKVIGDSERLIGEYQDQIELLKGSIRSFKSLRDRGAPFPTTFGSDARLLGQDGLLGQSRIVGLCCKSVS